MGDGLVVSGEYAKVEKMIFLNKPAQPFLSRHRTAKATFTALMLCLCVGCAIRLPALPPKTQTMPKPQRVTLVPLSQTLLPHLTSFSSRYAFFAEGNEPYNSRVGFNADTRMIIHFDRHEGMKTVTDTGFTPLSFTPSENITLVPVEKTDRTYHRRINSDNDCVILDWKFEPFPFEGAFGATDVVGEFHLFGFTSASNEVTAVDMGNAVINGIAAHHYRLDEAASLTYAQARTLGFDGSLTGDVYVATDGGYVVKADFEMRGDVIPTSALPFTTGIMKGVSRLSYEISDLNSAPPVTLPVGCSPSPR